MFKFLKNLFFELTASWSTLRGQGSILMYHSISDSGAFLSVSPMEFEKHLAYLVRQKFDCVTMSEFLKRQALGTLDRTVCLTFDDGYQDNLSVALPLLQRYQIPATICIVPELLGTTFKTSDGYVLPLLSAAELKELASTELFECIPHSLTHANLDTVDFDRAVAEIEGSRLALERLTESPASIFAFPRGRSTPELVSYLRTSGRWDGALTVRPGLVTKASDPFVLPRNSIDTSTTFAQFRGSLSQAVVWYNQLKS